MPNPRSRQLVAAFILFALCACGFAQAPQRLGLCASCHGERGVATAKNLPNLAGQNLDYLRTAIAQYRDGSRNVPVMRAATGMMNAAELDQILQWYSLQIRPTSSP